MKNTIALFIFLCSLQTGWSQWTTVDTDNFDGFPDGFSNVGFSRQAGGAETGGASDLCAYRLNVGTNPTTLYLSKRYLLEAGYIYRFSFYMKRQNNPCGITFKHSSSAGTGGIVVSSEFTPPQRADSLAGDLFVSNEITGTQSYRHLKAVVTSGPANGNNNRLRIDGFTLERMSALPITLLSFTAVQKDDKVVLNWQTASENNNDYMALEHSKDGKVFLEIGQVMGAGTSTESKTYQFIDSNPHIGKNYYRLRQVDFDGRTEYHKTISVNVEQQNSGILIFPTIATNKLETYFPEIKTKNASIYFFDTSGKQWKNGHLSRGSTQYSFDISTLPKGLYFVHIIDGQEVSIEQFLKQ